MSILFLYLPNPVRFGDGIVNRTFWLTFEFLPDPIRGVPGRLAIFGVRTAFGVLGWL